MFLWLHRGAFYNKKKWHPLCHFGADFFSAELHCNSNSTNGLQRLLYIIFYSDDRQKTIGDISILLLFLPISNFFFSAVLDMDWGLSKWWPPTSPLSFFFIIFFYKYTLISDHSLCCQLQFVLFFSPLKKWCLYTKSVTPYFILLSAIQHPHRLSTHTHFSLSLFQLSSTNDNFCAKEKLWSFILTPTVIFIIFLLFFLFGGEQ